MRRSIDEWDGPGTGFAIIATVAYVDSLILYCWRPLPLDVLEALRKEYRRRLIVKEHTRVLEVRARGRCRKWWCTITIHQPREADLKTLATFEPTRLAVHAVDIAIDALCPDPRQADLATAFLGRHLVQKWRRRNCRTVLHKNTAYWSQNRRKPRNIVLYCDRPSKTGLGSCSHLELRFKSAAACKRAGVGELSALIRGPDIMALLEHQTWLAFIDRKCLARAVEKRARLNLHNTRRRSPDNTVVDEKSWIQPLLAIALKDEGCPLDENAIYKARSQELWDCFPTFRYCLVRLDWTNFTPQPRWYGW